MKLRLIRFRRHGISQASRLNSRFRSEPVSWEADKPKRCATVRKATNIISSAGMTMASPV